MVEKFFEFIEDRLRELRDKGLYRQIYDCDFKSGMRIWIAGREYINFASNDYLGLSQHPLVKEAATEAAKSFGVGAAASRLLCGGTVLHKKIEELISTFKGAEKSLILNSGYAANTSVIPALADEQDVLFSDELNHASIIDGCRLSKAKRLIYRHRDLEHLISLIEETPCRGKRIIVTDSVFSMDGDIAPIRELYELCKAEGMLLYIDDAHGTGVLGEGYGALKHFGLPHESFIVQMGTLSKAVGSFGAFVSAAKSIIELLINSSRGFIFSTALPPTVVAAAFASLRIISENRDLVKNLWSKTNRVIRFIEELGIKRTATETPIIPIVFESLEDAFRASEILRDLGIYAPTIRPPTVKTPRIRISISAAHSDDEIDRLCEGLVRINNAIFQRAHQV